MSLTEFSIIERYFTGLTPDARGVALGTGDDAALLAVDADVHLAVSTDSLVSGVHFFPDADPADIGYKALAVNLSDMAAMAVAPRWFNLALALPDACMTHAWLDGFTRGLAQLARSHNIALVGGDLCKGPLTVTIQIIGECPKGQAVRRSGASPGDSICISGEVGGAALALDMISAGQTPHPDCHRRLLRPLPRVDLGLALRGIASAMIDISDGLLADLGHLLDASHVGARVDIDAIPLDERVREQTDSAHRWRRALAGGDDYELCFTVPGAKLPELKKISAPLRCIGAITAEQGLRCFRNDGAEYIPDASGYEH